MHTLCGNVGVSFRDILSEVLFRIFMSKLSDKISKGEIVFAQPIPRLPFDLFSRKLLHNLGFFPLFIHTLLLFESGFWVEVSVPQRCSAAVFINGSLQSVKLMTH